MTAKQALKKLTRVDFIFTLIYLIILLPLILTIAFLGLYSGKSEVRLVIFLLYIPIILPLFAFNIFGFFNKRKLKSINCNLSIEEKKEAIVQVIELFEEVRLDNSEAPKIKTYLGEYFLHRTKSVSNLSWAYSHYRFFLEEKTIHYSLISRGHRGYTFSFKARKNAQLFQNALQTKFENENKKAS